MTETDDFALQIGRLAKVFNHAMLDFIDAEAPLEVTVHAVLMGHLASSSMMLAGLSETDRASALQWFKQHASKELNQMCRAVLTDYTHWRDKHGMN